MNGVHKEPLSPNAGKGFFHSRHCRLTTTGETAIYYGKDCYLLREKSSSTTRTSAHYYGRIYPRHRCMPHFAGESLPSSQVTSYFSLFIIYLFNIVFIGIHGDKYLIVSADVTAIVLESLHFIVELANVL